MLLHLRQPVQPLLRYVQCEWLAGVPLLSTQYLFRRRDSHKPYWKQLCSFKDICWAQNLFFRHLFLLPCIHNHRRKRPFETSSRSVLKKTQDFFEQLVCYIIKLFAFGEKGVQCKRCNVKELKWEMDLSRNYGVLWMEDNTSPLYFQELGRNLAKKTFFFRCRKSQLAV